MKNAFFDLDLKFFSLGRRLFEISVRPVEKNFDILSVDLGEKMVGGNRVFLSHQAKCADRGMSAVFNLARGSKKFQAVLPGCGLVEKGGFAVSRFGCDLLPLIFRQVTR